MNVPHTSRLTTVLRTRSGLGSLLMMLSVCAASEAAAQIIYHDIPDGVPTTIDFNADNEAEFDVLQDGLYITYFSMGAANNFDALGTAGSGWDVPKGLSAGTIIGPGGNWIGQGDCSLNAWGQGNASITLHTDEYLGVRFNFSTGPDVHYGWIRVTLTGPNTVVYKDHAYNSVPDAPITAGQGAAVGIGEVEQATLIIHPNPVRDVLTISSTGTPDVRILQVLDPAGRIVVQASGTTAQVDLRHLVAGLYVARAITGDGVVLANRRIIKQ
jgi:hypothetical protein